MRIAFVTCADWAEGREDDRHVAELVGADFQVWDDQDVDWSAYDRVVLRSCWDYSRDVSKFLGWCRSVGAPRLLNPLDLVVWNADKRYLAELAMPTVPTRFLAPGDRLPESDEEIVVKPNVSAGARNTGRFTPARRTEAIALIDLIHASGRIALVQPYLDAVASTGETAVVIIAGAISHVLRKGPILRTDGIAPLAPDDEHGTGPAAVMYEPDLIVAGEASAAELAIATGVHAELAARFGTPLYLRVDMIPGRDGAPVVLEVEAIEPALSLGHAPGAAARFAVAVLAAASTTS